MARTIPTSTPLRLYAGDTLEFKISLSEYPASDSWILYYVLVNSSAKITFNSTADGDVHLIDIAPATTANYTAGTYSWQSYVSNGTDRYTVDSGEMVIKADYSEQTTLDDRSVIKITLDALESTLQGRASKTQSKVKVGDKEIQYLTHSELIKAIESYRKWYDQEKVAEDLLNGNSTKSKVYTRFVNAI